MTKAYSNDLRERVVGAVLAGESCFVVAARFGVAKSSAIKWTQRFKVTGSVAPAKMGGYRPFLLEPHRDFIIKRLQNTSHLSLKLLQEELAARGVRVSHDTVWRFLKRHGLSFKKNTVRT